MKPMEFKNRKISFFVQNPGFLTLLEWSLLVGIGPLKLIYFNLLTLTHK